ncbi:hypothetical protein H9L01_03865 [Erysipelothrix inopinata]|uniref:Uncharacterized protein n=1 Tax=Erysipelothrix inopinata TaxID=225084 RepID=A0A7G9S0Y2_9FIRM|nr:hypothetical protein [Erysipelothrix inopinata]QNN61507.1 hypothetical protein H9L01_03865 [Erysipelothrix inopinata]
MKDKHKQSRALMGFILVLSLITVSVGSYYIVKANNNRSGIEKIGHVQDKNNFYTLRNNATEYQKELYAQLTEELSKPIKDDEKISELVAKSFVADYFTWSNKLRNNDVGGIQYIMKDYQKSVYDYATDTMYNDAYYYIQKGKVSETLEVTKINSTTSKDTFELISKDKKEPNEKIEGYRVTLDWEYKPSTVVETSKYQNKASIMVVKDTDGMFSIMEVTNGKEGQQ